MTAAEHPVSPEDVMAYCDGALAADRSRVVEAHVARCERCRQLRDEVHATSRDLALWRVEEPPATLVAPAPALDATTVEPRGWLRWRRPSFVGQFAGVSVVALFVVAASLVVSFGRATKAPQGKTLKNYVSAAVLKGEQSAAGGSRASPQVIGEKAGPSEPRKGPMIARTATLRIVASDFDAARRGLERILTGAGGFVGRIDASGARGTARTLTATLRVPSQALDAALAEFRKLGQVVGEAQGGDDVTEEVVDLEARLVNAKNTEKRLTDVLQRRTGDVADVLAVEREIARVRGEIERFEAGRKNLEQRIAYATLTLEVTEEHKAALDLGPLTVSARLRNAFVDGCRDAFESALEATVILMRLGPVMLLWAAVCAWPAVLILRWHRRPVGGASQR